MRTRPSHRWSRLLLCLLLAATAVGGQERDPEGDAAVAPGTVEQLLSRAFQELGAERYEPARDLFESAWAASGSQSAEAALGMAQASALLRQPRAAEEQARLAIDLAQDDRTKSAALLLHGAAAYQVLLDYEAEGPGDGEELSPLDLKVRLAATMAFLENGLELAQGDPTGARVLLAEAYLRARFPEKARAVLDEYFEDGGAPQMRAYAENLRCLAGGSQAEFEPPPPTSEIQRPVKLSAPQPRYTEEARLQGWQGDAIVQAVIDENGDVACARMAKGAPHGLAESALGAVRQWRFEPAKHEGKPIKAMLYLGIRFELGQGDG